MKHHILFITFLLIASCNTANKKRGLLSKFGSDQQKKKLHHYTADQHGVFEMGMTTGEYAILKDDNKLIDTIFNYSSFARIGDDSVVYVKIKAETSQTRDVGSYWASPKYLIVYNGQKRTVMYPPFFDPHFSSFIVDGESLIYWGFRNFEVLYACKYNLREKDLKAVIIGTPVGTDNFSVYEQPKLLNNGNIEFNLILPDTIENCQIDKLFRKKIS